MGCRKYQKSLVDYVNGTLDAGTRKQVESHLESCTECSAAVEKLELSSVALASLSRPALGDQASSRMLSAIHSGKVSVPRASWFHLPKPALAAGALAVVALIAVFVVIGVVNNNHVTQKNTSELGMTFPANDGGSIPAAFESTAAKSANPQLSTSGMLASIGPIVKKSQNDYNQSTLKDTFEALPERKQFATQYTMADAVKLSSDYSAQCCQKYAGLGEDPALLEAIINSVMVSEPVEIPYYVEKATYTGRPVVIIAFVAPRKGGASMNLIRNDVWVWDPVQFTTNPNNSLVVMFQQTYEP